MSKTTSFEHGSHLPFSDECLEHNVRSEKKPAFVSRLILPCTRETPSEPRFSETHCHPARWGSRAPRGSEGMLRLEPYHTLRRNGTATSTRGVLRHAELRYSSFTTGPTRGSFIHMSPPNRPPIDNRLVKFPSGHTQFPNRGLERHSAVCMHRLAKTFDNVMPSDQVYY